MNVLVSLISGERMQNILPLFQRGWKFDRVVGLVTGNDTHDPVYKRAWDDMQFAMGEKAVWDLWPTPIPSTDFEASYLACREIIQSQSFGQVTLNFTGGTKPMSFGAYRAAIELGAALLYVDTESERFYYHHPPQPPEYVAFDLQPITVRTCLNLQGKHPDESRIQARNADHLINLGKEMAADRKQTIRCFSDLQSQMPSDEQVDDILLADTDLTELTWAVHLLHKHQLITIEASGIRIPRDTIHFLKGGWLEQYTLGALRQDAKFMDVLSPLAIHEFRDEIDAAVIYKGKMGIIECKTGNLRGKIGTNVLKQLYEYRVKLSGPFGKAFLVTTGGSFTRHLNDRAADYPSPIIIIAGDDLLHLEEIILQEMKVR